MTARRTNVLIEPHSATVWCGFLRGSAFGKYSGGFQLPVLYPAKCSNLDAHLLCGIVDLLCSCGLVLVGLLNDGQQNTRDAVARLLLRSS